MLGSVIIHKDPSREPWDSSCPAAKNGATGTTGPQGCSDGGERNEPLAGMGTFLPSAWLGQRPYGLSSVGIGPCDLMHEIDTPA